MKQCNTEQQGEWTVVTLGGEVDLSWAQQARRTVLDALAFTYERLAEVVALSRDQQYNAYKNVLIRDPKLTYLQKRDLAKQWLQTDQTIGQNRQAILAHVSRLKTLRTEYDGLYQQVGGPTKTNKFRTSNRLTYSGRSTR